MHTHSHVHIRKYIFQISKQTPTHTTMKAQFSEVKLRGLLYSSNLTDY
uniref:Uncharacterized protein n=1 Tax=Rhizophora mucronata TaxID=61149 RepID=A0A2P2PPA8_RHIMU